MRKRLAAFLMALFIWFSPTGAALADPDTDDIVIRQGESSDNVILLQMRLQDLGYYSYKITGFFGDFTKSSLIDFQKTNGLKADGVAGAKTLELMYGNNAKRNPVVDVNPKPKPKVKKVKYGQYLDWFDKVRNMWPRGAAAKVVDFYTGKSYTMIRVGGIYHADIEPATTKDCGIFKATYDGKWSWNRRPVVVYIGGVAVAGSTNGMPHGYETVRNNGMTGQVCIHFKNSRTHVHNMIDPDHQRHVKIAAGLIK